MPFISRPYCTRNDSRIGQPTYASRLNLRKILLIYDHYWRQIDQHAIFYELTNTKWEVRQYECNSVLRPPNLGCDLERDTGKLKKGKQQNQIQNTKEKRTTTNKDAFNLLPKYCTNWPLQGYPPEYVQERTLSGIEDGHIFYQDTIMVLLHNLFKSGLKSLNRTIKNAKK